MTQPPDPPADAPGVSLVKDEPTEDEPTEALPVVADTTGRHRADPDDADADLVTKWREPRSTRRATIGLIAALLVALGFLAGVIVGRAAAPQAPGDTARPVVTGPARPGVLR